MFADVPCRGKSLQSGAFLAGMEHIAVAAEEGSSPSGKRRIMDDREPNARLAHRSNADPIMPAADGSVSISSKVDNAVPLEGQWGQDCADMGNSLANMHSLKNECQSTTSQLDESRRGALGRSKEMLSTISAALGGLNDREDPLQESDDQVWATHKTAAAGIGCSSADSRQFDATSADDLAHTIDDVQKIWLCANVETDEIGNRALAVEHIASVEKRGSQVARPSWNIENVITVLAEVASQ